MSSALRRRSHVIPNPISGNGVPLAAVTYCLSWEPSWVTINARESEQRCVIAGIPDNMEGNGVDLIDTRYPHLHPLTNISGFNMKIQGILPGEETQNLSMEILSSTRHLMYPPPKQKVEVKMWRCEGFKYIQLQFSPGRALAQEQRNTPTWEHYNCFLTIKKPLNYGVTVYGCQTEICPWPEFHMWKSKHTSLCGCVCVCVREWVYKEVTLYVQPWFQIILVLVFFSICPFLALALSLSLSLPLSWESLSFIWKVIVW